MIGHVKHVKKCLELGADLICAQGGEGGGHTVCLQHFSSFHRNTQIANIV